VIARLAALHANSSKKSFFSLYCFSITRGYFLPVLVTGHGWLPVIPAGEVIEIVLLARTLVTILMTPTVVGFQVASIASLLTAYSSKMNNSSMLVCNARATL